MNQDQKIKEIVLLLLGSLSILSIICLSYFTWPSSDDISLYLDLAHRSVWQQCTSMYMHWDGRGFSLPGLIQYSLLKYTSSRFTVFIWSLLFCCTVFLFYRILVLEMNQESTLSKKQVFISISFLSLVFWYGMWSHICQTVYWATGGVYICGCFWASILLYTILRMVKRDFKTYSSLHKIRYFFLVICLSFVGGSIAQNLFPALIVFYVLQYTISIKEIRSQTFLYILFIASFLALLLGGLVLYAAPGNYSRASLGPNTLHLGFMPIVRHALFAIAFYGYKSIALVLSVGVALFALFLASRKRISQTSFSLKILFNEGFWSFLENYKWLLVAMTTMLPFVVVPDFISPRTAIFFMFFLAIFLFHFASIKATHLITEEKKDTPLNTKTLFYMLSCIFVLHLLVMTVQFRSAYYIQKDIMQRYNYLQQKSNQGKNIIVNVITKPIPFALQFDDISKDSCYWINKAVSKYYHLHSITLKLK